MVGKGGVGRSIVAASIAAASAAEGKRTLLFEANAKDRFGEFFGVAPVGEEITQVRDNLYAVNTNPAAALQEYGLMILKFRRVYRLVFENRVTEAFIRAIPGIEDYAILGKAWYHTKESEDGKPVWDTVVFDMAASGHSLSMLRIPWAITDAVPEGPLTRDAQTVKELLGDRERTAVVMVTIAEDMPTSEAIELQADLREHVGLEVQHLVVNQLYEDRFPDGSPQDQIVKALNTDNTGDAVLEATKKHAWQYQQRRKLNEAYLQRLSKAFSATQTHLFRRFLSKLGPEDIDEIANQLRQ